MATILAHNDLLLFRGYSCSKTALCCNEVQVYCLHFSSKTNDFAPFVRLQVWLAYDWIVCLIATFDFPIVFEPIFVNLEDFSLNWTVNAMSTCGFCTRMYWVEQGEHPSWPKICGYCDSILTIHSMCSLASFQVFCCWWFWRWRYGHEYPGCARVRNIVYNTIRKHFGSPSRKQGSSRNIRDRLDCNHRILGFQLATWSLFDDDWWSLWTTFQSACSCWTLWRPHWCSRWASRERRAIHGHWNDWM